MSDNTKALTVHDATYNLLRKLGLTTIFGNLGSTEQPFLKNFPPDFKYERLAHFAERIRKSKNPVLLYGPEIERAGGWDAGIKFAERLRAPVYMTPLSDKASFPQTHPQFRGMAPFAIGPLSKKLRGHDLIIVVGAQVFRYYPYVAGDYLPQGAELLQIPSDPYDAAAAIVGDSLLADAKLALEVLNDAIPEVKS